MNQVKVQKVTKDFYLSKLYVTDDDDTFQTNSIQFSCCKLNDDFISFEDVVLYTNSSKEYDVVFKYSPYSPLVKQCYGYIELKGTFINEPFSHLLLFKDDTLINEYMLHHLCRIIYREVRTLQQFKHMFRQLDDKLLDNLDDAYCWHSKFYQNCIKNDIDFSVLLNHHFDIHFNTFICKHFQNPFCKCLNFESL
jgi:hypothetical protein